MMATGGQAGYFGYYDARSGDCEVVGWVGYGCGIFEAGRQDGEWHVMGIGVGKFGSSGSRAPPSTAPTPSPIESTPVTAPGVTPQPIQSTTYEQTIKDVSGSYPSPLTENEVKTPEQRGREAVSVSRTNLSLGSKIVRGLGIANAQTELFLWKIVHAPIHVATAMSEPYGPQSSPITLGLEYLMKSPEAASAAESFLPYADEFLENQIAGWESRLEYWRNYGR